MTCVLGNKTKICFPHYRLLSHYYSAAAAAVHSTIDSVKYLYSSLCFSLSFSSKKQFWWFGTNRTELRKTRWDEVEEVFHSLDGGKLV